MTMTPSEDGLETKVTYLTGTKVWVSPTYHATAETIRAAIRRIRPLHLLGGVRKSETVPKGVIECRGAAGEVISRLILD